MDVASNLETLHAIAQIAITLIGFSGIVVVFGERSAVGWTSDEALRFYILIAGPLTALACSFVPILLSQLATDSAVVWRISNAVLGAAHLGNMMPFLLRKHGAKPTLGQKFNAAIGVTLISAHFLAALNMIPWFSFIFITGLLQQTWIGLHNFLLLFTPSRQRVEDGDSVT
jgi:hypothetical protein